MASFQTIPKYENQFVFWGVKKYKNRIYTIIFKMYVCLEGHRK